MKTRQQIIRTIKDKAYHQRALASHHFQHDPEPQTPDVQTTVNVRSRWEVQL